jgi:hypothetical protein
MLAGCVQTRWRHLKSLAELFDVLLVQLPFIDALSVATVA